MLIPIDIIWIYDSYIIGYEDNVPVQPGTPDGLLRIYTSPEPVNTVLEVRAGLRKERGWEVGDHVNILLD